MSKTNKIQLTVKKDLNGWYKFEKGAFRVQLAGDQRLDWFWLEQYAKKAGHPNFLSDFTDILKLMEKDGAAAFNIYHYDNDRKQGI